MTGPSSDPSQNNWLLAKMTIISIFIGIIADTADILDRFKGLFPTQTTNNATLSQTQDAKDYYNRGNVYRNQGEYEKAITEFNQAIRLNPKFAEPYYGRGGVYFDQGKYEKAIADYSESIRLKNPSLWLLHNNRGLVYFNQGKYEKAIADYNQAIRLEPKYAAPYYNRGLIYKRNKDIEKAISDFEKAADLHKQEGDQKWHQYSLDQLKELRGY
ncbi:tetratricopeptide repeat protein [Okeania sp. SIO1I7]|uniref:tetratricopeptide repeat protein n=1 Tax=Okeania sp. SIO1I7 TaxID=2607772 RepID=UPI0013F817F7|nr:tetratricopeptide repeat protein [Okeania sp. SIO1I7]NET26390.1 tetratricopeptide repeat protein [Okeania sp. SIO1I7]